MDISALPYTVDLQKNPDDCGISFVYVDQTKLPQILVMKSTSDWHEVLDAIKCLEIRGAPAIGLAGAAAYVLAMYSLSNDVSPAKALDCMVAIKNEIASARPTAVNLSWAVEKMHAYALESVSALSDIKTLKNILFKQVKQMEQEDEAANRAMGAFGASLLPKNARVLTHCNAGSLATRFFGTALGVIYSAAEFGKISCVFVDETRPVGQGARLSAWELSQAGIDATLICDNMAASIMAKGEVDVVIVGADRICKNGDVVNKIGTYGLAIAAQYHKIPFYVAAPLSSIDLNLSDGSLVEIEQRAKSEITKQVLANVDVYNPAFDMTPASLVSAVITERGIFSTYDGSWNNLVH